jgi:steroid delta-isomerase-like uncharacterized protein
MAESSTVTNNKKIAKRYLEECWSKPDLELLDHIVAPDAKGFNFPFFPQGSQGINQVRRGIIRMRSIFPDLHITVNSLIAEGNKVVADRTIRGTQLGEWEKGIPPTRNQVSLRGITIYTIEEGKISELVEVEDGLSFLQQINALKTWNPPS